ncbi:siderophore ABC transporter substrate-binding protein [Gemmobacter sp.]|uniref:siderophore ABC transporter substrate-binding protein n=1 Tax=Gemmobacter sp. TaxID=1898957 RepID=UPI002AFE68D0|nr:siderophore ABC transporter substrate-binding protein [Gemmobacter sp.]
MIRLSRAGLVAAALALSSLALSAPVAAADVTIATAKGPVTLPAGPATVAVLDVAAIDTIGALGVMPAAVPDKLYVGYLGTEAAAPRAGTLFEPDLEALANLGPDLIIAGGRSATKVAALAEVAPTIDMTMGPDLLAEAQARIAAYGALFGKADKAAELSAALEAKLAAARAATAGKGRALILQTNGPKVSAYGKGSRFGWIHTALDLPEAHASLSPEVHGDAVSFEFIAETNPDWLIVIDRASAIGEASSAQATLDNPLVKGTTAGQRGQIVYLSPAPIYIAGGGFRSLTGTLDELIAAFGK